MAKITRRLVQSASFEEFYPTTMTYVAAKKSFFLAHSKDTSFNVYTMTEKGTVDVSTPTHKGKLNNYLSNIQALYDTVKNKQYLYGYNLEAKVIEFYSVADNGNIDYLRGDEFGAGSDMQSATIFILNGVIHLYSQDDKTKNWKIHKFIVIE